jgi:propanol-preferring alcohol dehydrogenase
VKAIKEGYRVDILWLHTAYGYCEYCLNGWETLHHLQKNTGYSVNRCYAEYVLADPNYIGHLHQELDFAASDFTLCEGLTVYKGIKETDIKWGD